MLEGQEKVRIIKNIVISVAKDEEWTNDDKVEAFRYLIGELKLSEFSAKRENGK